MFFLNLINFSSLCTPRTLAFKSEKISVNFCNGVFITGHFSSILISNNLTRSLENGKLSKAPGASSFLKSDLETSYSGEIIISIGKFVLVNNPFHIGLKILFDLILAIFLVY